MRLIKVTFFLFIVWASVVLGFMAWTVHETARAPLQDASAYNAELVYETCQQSRMSPTIDERGCADLQDQLGYEYLCKANNASADNVCWVEKH